MSYAPYAKGFSGEDLTSPEAIRAHNEKVNALADLCRTYGGYVRAINRHTAIQIGAADPLDVDEWLARKEA